MSSTEFNVGLASDKNSSRVLKPPGGGHHDIFGAPEQRVHNPRPKYDQQNSSNLNSCMNTTDPNILLEMANKDSLGKVEDLPELNDKPSNTREPPPRVRNNITGPAEDAKAPAKGRVPPGGFSSGFWVNKYPDKIFTMSSSEFNIGLVSGKTSSRGPVVSGTHNDIFGPPEHHVYHPRSKYDQQNSTNINSCMNTIDPGDLLEMANKDSVGKVEDSPQFDYKPPTEETREIRETPPRVRNNITRPAEEGNEHKGRVPPGGFSAGFW